MTSNEISLPTSALAPNGTPPEPGSPIEIQTIKGTVTRSEGGTTTFRLTEINGRPIEGGDGQADQAADEMPTREGLLARAMKEDDEGMGY